MSWPHPTSPTSEGTPQRNYKLRAKEKNQIRIFYLFLYIILNNFNYHIAESDLIHI